MITSSDVYAIRWREGDGERQGFLGSLDRGVFHYPCLSLAEAHIEMVIASGGAAVYEVVVFSPTAAGETVIGPYPRQ